jgi:hypothetical protein
MQAVSAGKNAMGCGAGTPAPMELGPVDGTRATGREPGGEGEGHEWGG